MKLVNDRVRRQGSINMGKNLAPARSGEQIGQIGCALLGSFVLACDYLAAPVVVAIGPGSAAPVFFAGLIAGQLGLAATWVVFSSRRYLHRLGISAAVGFVSYGFLALGVFTAGGMVSRGPPSEVAAVLVAFLFLCPLVFFAVQLPMWIARTWLWLEIAGYGHPSVGSYLRVTGIRDLITATAGASVALAGARIGAAVFPEGTPGEALFMFVIMAGVAAVGSLVSLLPLIYFVLGTGTVVAGCMRVLIWFGVVNAILTTFLAVVGAPRGAMLACCLLTGSFTVIFCGGLLLTRMTGYRLRRRKRAQPVVDEPMQQGNTHLS